MRNSVPIFKKTQARGFFMGEGKKSKRVNHALPALSIYAVNWVALGIFACCA